jgi:hypothetical protein
MRIMTEDLNIKEVEKLIMFVKELKQLDYSTSIKSIKNSAQLVIEFKEV